LFPIETITEIQHEFHDIIKVSLHSHVTHERCLEVILVQGVGEQLKALTEKMMSLKGVESVNLMEFIVKALSPSGQASYSPRLF